MSDIEIINLNKKIGDKEILKNINISFSRGNIYGFFGRNGSGKTMLFRAISGLIKPTSGEIKIFNKVLHKDISFPEKLGIIIETPGFWDYYTGFENLKVLASIKEEINDDEIRNSIERVGLDASDLRTVSKYSLGMKQRLAIAQAIMEKPDLLVLDEPTNGLDEEGVELVHKILLEEKKRGAIVLIASHNKDDINVLSDKKINIDNGILKEIQA